MLLVSESLGSRGPESFSGFIPVLVVRSSSPKSHGGGNVTTQNQSATVKEEREDEDWLGNQLFAKFNNTFSFRIQFHPV